MLYYKIETCLQISATTVVYIVATIYSIYTVYIPYCLVRLLLVVNTIALQ